MRDRIWKKKKKKKRKTWSRKSFLSCVYGKILLNEGSKINFEAVETDILGGKL